ncbi:MAG: HAD family hydrolase [Candidatus Velamenicoccus archaeovorus]
MSVPTAVAFDLGGVVIDWDPRHLYRKVFEDPAEMERFLSTVCTPAWNDAFDRGHPFREGVERLVREHPELAGPIRAYLERWDEMLAGPIPGTVEVLLELRRRGVRLFALSNWSTETFPHARMRYEVLGWFEGILLSGEVGVTKPAPGIYRAFLERFHLRARDCAFVDDRPANVETARRLGFPSVVFRSPMQLREELRGLGLLEGARAAER